MTAVPPPAAPAAAPTPTPPVQDLSTAGDAARDRLAQAFPDNGIPGDGTPPPAGGEGVVVPPAEGAPLDIFADDALDNLDFGALPYRDGKKLENEIRSARDRFRPFNDAFGQMDDASRQQLLQVAPTLGNDLATLSATAGQLHPDDRAYFVEAMQLMQTDPQAAAERLAFGASQIRAAYAEPGAAPPAAPAPPPVGQSGAMPEWADPDLETEPVVDPLDQPMTMRQWQEAQRQQDYARDVAAQETAVLEEARGLGYDPDSTDPVAAARLTTLVALAGRPDIGGDLTKAHELMEQARQADIDAFVAGKTADAASPTAPLTGAPPAQPRVLETAEDAEAAMRNRLEATLGRDPRRRDED